MAFLSTTCVVEHSTGITDTDRDNYCQRFSSENFADVADVIENIFRIFNFDKKSFVTKFGQCCSLDILHLKIKRKIL